MKPDKVLDCTGLFCPLPVVKTKLMMADMTSGEVLELIADDPGAKKDVPAWCDSTGEELLKVEDIQNEFRFYIKKK